MLAISTNQRGSISFHVSSCWTFLKLAMFVFHGMWCLKHQDIYHVLASGGSLILFDRKVLRYFRKDGHNWRKKKDGKTVKEAHERLKVSYIWLISFIFSVWRVYDGHILDYTLHSDDLLPSSNGHVSQLICFTFAVIVSSQTWLISWISSYKVYHRH